MTGVQFPAGAGFFLLATAFRSGLGPTLPPVQWVSGFYSARLKRPRREADHPPPSSAEVKNAWSYTSTPAIRIHCVVPK
jgi:hypothetical protein